MFVCKMSHNTLDSYLGLCGKRKADNELSQENCAKRQKTPVIAHYEWQTKWDKAYPWAEKHFLKFQPVYWCWYLWFHVLGD